MTEPQTDSGVASEERVELATYIASPKQLFAYGRLWERERSVSGGSGIYVVTYRPSEDKQVEMDVLAAILSKGLRSGPFWETDELMLFLDEQAWNDGAIPNIRKVFR